MSETEIGNIQEHEMLTAEEFKAQVDAKLLDWENFKSELELAKEKEMDLRKKFVAFAFDPAKKKGTENLDLNNGYKAKVVKKLNYNVNKDLVNECLDQIENVGGAEGKIIADHLIKWTPDLSLTEYNILESKYKVIIDKCITQTEGAPTLEIVAPKGAKRS